MRKMPVAHIAKELGIHRSTIHREIKRNTHFNGTKHYYTPSKAQEHANGRKRKPRKPSHLTNEDISEIKAFINKDYSPDQIAHSVPLPSGATISHESIYKLIYRDKKNGGTLHLHLRHRSRKRRKRYRSKDRRGRLEGKRMIDTRPSIINQRTTLGHWEIDTVMGTGSKDCLLTMVERKSGYTMIAKLKNRTAEEVTKKAIQCIKTSAIPFITITADNGSEFHSYKEIEKETQCSIYFANPHHSWERGTNENTNGLIRQYFPKGINLKCVTQQQCDHVANILNTRPRKRHNYQSPNSVILQAA
jgi:IS30 family transposase